MPTSVQIQRLPQTTGCFDADRAVEIPLEQFSQKIPPNTTSRDIGGLKRMTLATRWKRIRLVLLQWELLQIQSAGINSRYIEHAYFRHVFPYFHVNLNVVSQLSTHTRTHSMDSLRCQEMKEFGDDVRSEQGNPNFSSSSFHTLPLRSLQNQ